MASGGVSVRHCLIRIVSRETVCDPAGLWHEHEVSISCRMPQGFTILKILFSRTSILYLQAAIWDGQLSCSCYHGFRAGSMCVGFLLLYPGAWRTQSYRSFDSGPCEVLARHGWYLHVSLHRFPACYATQLSLSSWEFFTTLNYEWRVIRGDLPYRWTIWVRNDRDFTLTHLTCCALGLIRPFGRSTPSHVYPLS